MKSIDLAGLVMSFVLAPPTAAPMQDSPKDKTPASQKKQIMPKDLLKSLVGSWEGTCETWFQPGKLADESKNSSTMIISRSPHTT